MMKALDFTNSIISNLMEKTKESNVDTILIAIKETNDSNLQYFIEHGIYRDMFHENFHYDIPEDSIWVKWTVSTRTINKETKEYKEYIMWKEGIAVKDLIIGDLCVSPRSYILK